MAVSVDGCSQCLAFGRCKHIRFCLGCIAQVFFHIFHGAHTADGYAYFGNVPQVIQCPLRIGFSDTGRGKRIAHHLWQVGKEAGADRLHYRQPHTVGSSIFRTEHTCLVFIIKVIVLDEAEIPCRCIFDYPFEQLQAVVEGESHKAYFPLRLQILHLLDKPIRQHIVFPCPVHNHVDVVEIDYIGIYGPS